MELHAHVFVKHADKKVHQLLSTLFTPPKTENQASTQTVEQSLRRVSLALSPANGEALCIRLFDTVKQTGSKPTVDLKAEDKWEIAGYHVYFFVHGGDGDAIVEAIITFIGELVPEVDVRAWLQGDDDPWEVFFRYIESQTAYKEYEPDAVERARELPKEYVWFHDELPTEISFGIINEWKAMSDEEWIEEGILVDEEPVKKMPKPGKVTGQVWKTTRTESGLIIKNKGWPGRFTSYDAILDDMSQVKHGDTVKVQIQSVDEDNRLLNCTLVERLPIKN